MHILRLKASHNTLASYPGLCICVGGKWRPGTHCLCMCQILHKICVNRVISVQFHVFIMSQIQFGYSLANSASSKIPSFIECVSYTWNTAYEWHCFESRASIFDECCKWLYYLSTDKICKKSVPLVLQPLTREQTDSLDVQHDIPADLANSRTFGSHNSVLAEAAVRIVPLQKQVCTASDKWHDITFGNCMLNSHACANSVYQAFVSHTHKHEGLGTRLTHFRCFSKYYTMWNALILKLNDSDT